MVHQDWPTGTMAVTDAFTSTPTTVLEVLHASWVADYKRLHQTELEKGAYIMLVDSL